MYGVDRSSVVRKPVTILRLTSDFVGPFQKNWLYLSALSFARFQNNNLALIPYQVDALTVLGMTSNGNGECVWEVAEDTRAYRAWTKASVMIVSMSGAQYGGKAQIVALEGAHTVRSRFRYADHIMLESVRLIPMIMGRVITMSMNPQSIDVEFQFDPETLFTERL